MSLCSSSLGSPAASVQWKSVRCTIRSGYSCVTSANTSPTLARLHFAADELPQKRPRLVFRPLADQKLFSLPNERRHHFHRLLLHFTSPPPLYHKRTPRASPLPHFFPAPHHHAMFPAAVLAECRNMPQLFLQK